MAGEERAASGFEEVFVTETDARPSLDLEVKSMRKLENEKLDEIGKLLVKAGTTPNRDIERAIANPALFDAVQKRIATIEERPSIRRSRLLVPGLASFASIALIAVVGFAFFKSAPVSKDLVSSPIVAPTATRITKYSEPDSLPVLRQPIEPTQITAERASHRAPAVRVTRPKQPVVEQSRFVDDFYAVSYAGDPHETERGGRIVRVDIPRSTLFAMGINVPLENESATVKADLLVGSDGVTRGIRVVD